MEFEFIATNCKSLLRSLAFPAVTGCYFELKRRKWHEVCYLIIKTNETNVKLVIYFLKLESRVQCQRPHFLFTWLHLRCVPCLLLEHDRTVNQFNVSRLSIKCWFQWKYVLIIQRSRRCLYSKNCDSYCNQKTEVNIQFLSRNPALQYARKLHAIHIRMANTCRT